MESVIKPKYALVHWLSILYTPCVYLFSIIMLTLQQSQSGRIAAMANMPYEVNRQIPAIEILLGVIVLLNVADAFTRHIRKITFKTGVVEFHRLLGPRLIADFADTSMCHSFIKAGKRIISLEKVANKIDILNLLDGKIPFIAKDNEKKPFTWKEWRILLPIAVLILAIALVIIAANSLPGLLGNDTWAWMFIFILAIGALIYGIMILKWLFVS